MDKALTRLKQLGNLQQLPYSTWAAQIIMECKPNGPVHVWADFTVVGNNFTVLNCNKSFTKLDFGAYVQIKVDQKSRKLLTVIRIAYFTVHIFQHVMDNMIQGLFCTAPY